MTQFPWLSVSARRPSGEGAVGSPLGRAVRLDEAHQGRGGQCLGGEDAALELEAEAAEGVAAEHNLCGLCVHDLPAWPHGAGGQRHCGAGGHGAQWGRPGQAFLWEPTQPRAQRPGVRGTRQWES